MDEKIKTLREETKLFLERCVTLLDEDYIVKYDERFWGE